MNEPPNSFWKRPLKSPRRLVFWGTLVACAGYLTAYIVLASVISPRVFLPLTFLTCVSFMTILAGVLYLSWPWIRRLNRRRVLIVLAWTATLLALFYGEENWRGRRAWTQYRQALEARGEKLDLQSFIPKPVPNEQNFAATPFIQSWFVQQKERNFVQLWSNVDRYAQAAKGVSDPEQKKKSERKFTDLVAWESAFDAIRRGETNQPPSLKPHKSDSESRAKAASVILAGLQPDDAVFTELRLASQRPHARYPVVYDLENPWGILLPHLGNIRAVAQRLRLKACAELAAGRSENALADVKLILYLADTVRDEPFLISYLVRIAGVQIAIQPIWEGLAEHRWTDAQLQELQSRLQQFDWVADLKRPLDTERAAGILTVDLIYRQKYRLSTLGIGTEGSPVEVEFGDYLCRIVPRGWFYQEQLSYCRLFDLLSHGTFEATRRRISPSQSASNERAMVRALGGRNPIDTIFIRHQLMAAILLPALGNLSFRSAIPQTALDQALLACALERHRLANGQFPEKLETLAPRFLAQLPRDVITGEPYKYRRTEEGQFVLYSVGWDEKDDGGTTENSLLPEKVGDWIWRYPGRP